MRPALNASRPASTAFFMAEAISTGFLCAGDGGVHQDPVTAQFHGYGGIRGGTHAGIDQDRYRGVLDDGEDVVGIADAEAGSNRRGQRHDGHATHFLEAPGDDRVVIGVDHDLEALPDQCFGGLQGLGDIRKQGLLVTEHLQLHQVVAVQQFACQAAGAYCVLGGITTGGVRQQGVAVRGDHVQQVGLTRILADIGAADGDGDDFGATGQGRLAGFIHIPVLAGTHQQAGGVFNAGDDQRVVEAVGF